MEDKYEVCLKNIIEEMGLTIQYGSEFIHEKQISTPDINRPGLELTGYTADFDKARIQLVGKAEMSYLNTVNPEERKEKIRSLFELDFPCLVIARDIEPFPEMEEISNKYKIPVLRTHDITTEFHSSLSRYLRVQLAPRTTMHACLVEIYGEGVLITGGSGVGKSETALELVKRGHRLVADDLVEIRKVSNRTLVGTAPEVIRHFIEIRGIGFLNVKRLYGVGAVKNTENVELVVHLEPRQDGKEYERVGLEQQYINILGLEMPYLTIPVMPGRNLAIVLEVAAMNHRQKMMGYNSAQELNRRVFEKHATITGGSFESDNLWR